MAKKIKNRYEKQKHPGLNAKYQVTNRRELFDQDYTHLLNEEEKAWLNKFNQETIITWFDENDDNNLIKGQKEKRKLYKENNKRNNDLYTNLKATNRLMYELTPKGMGDPETTKIKNKDISVGTVTETSSQNSEEDYMLTRIALKQLSGKKKKTADRS